MALLYRMGTGNGGSDIKPYIVNFTCDSGFIGKTVTMEFQDTPHAGETVDNVSGTVVLDSTDGKGKLTLYPMHDGLWKYYATSDVSGYQEGTITLEKWGNYPVELKDTPNGATVTPTDDVQTWLHCANIWDKTDLTTIDDVITDTTTLNILISNNNASDYLVRSTTWISDVCSNESAMTYIGLNDYCANKLLDNSTWLNAIGNSVYFDKVLNKSVPTLISNTGSDGGEASGDFENPAYYTFVDASDKLQGTSAISSPKYVAYDFKKPVIVRLIKIKSWGTRIVYKPWNMTLIGDNGAEKEICKLVGNNNTLEQKFNITNNSSYNKYKLVVKDAYKGSSTTEKSTDYCNLDYVNFYGREGV